MSFHSRDSLPESSPETLAAAQLEPRPTDSSFIAVSATFTAEPLQQVLAFWTRELNLDLPIKFAPFNQVFQQLLDPSGLLARNRGGVNIVLVRFEDWAQFGGTPASDLLGLEENVRHLVSCLHSAAAAFASPVIVCLCPPSPGFLAGPARAEFAARMQAFVESDLEPMSTVHLVRQQDLDALYPVAERHDPHGDELGHIPYTPAYFAALGTMLARKIQAIRSTPYKVIVLDCDETLWQGICGEDGPQGVVIDPPRRALQEFMLEQYRAGMLLCLCSKNNEEDVLETFRVHPEMPLKLEHFVARRINWEPKSNNLISLADDLDLDLDSFILVDDNPKECAEVAANCAGVLTLPLPVDVGQIPKFLQHVWAFNRAKVTDEDRKRTEMYGQRVERARLERQASNLEEFLASLNLQIRIEPVSPDKLPRVSQLTQRTNQMNTTTVRRSESEIQALVQSGQAECLTVDVSDRFGSYGLTGVVVFRTAPDALTVDSFLLSCRALGRGVEHRMLQRLGGIAEERRIGRVDVPFIPTQRNRPALKFLESVGADFRTSSADGLVFCFPAACARAIAYRPAGAPQKQPAAPREESPGNNLRPTADWLRIADELNDTGRILERVRLQSRNGAGTAASAAAPRTELEQRLASLWAELLGLSAVGIFDNFFDLGGHSLLAVQLLSRVRQAFDVDLSLEVVYSGAFTVSELARAIEVQQIEQTGGDYADILKELEGLSEEEVKALLAREEDPAGDQGAR